jgi:hypothetical protein
MFNRQLITLGCGLFAVPIVAMTVDAPISPVLADATKQRKTRVCSPSTRNITSQPKRAVKRYPARAGQPKRTLSDPNCPPEPTPRSVSRGAFNLIWQTNFDGPLDSRDWNVYNTRSYKAHRCYFSGNVYVRSGILNVIGARATSGPCARNTFGAAGLDTWTAHMIQNGGRWEVRAKLAGDYDASGRPTNYGFNSYIGVFPTGRDWSYEVDFAEHPPSRGSNLLFLTQHWQDSSGRHPQTGIKISGSQWAAAFRTYAVEILPRVGTQAGQIRYFIDDRLVGTQPLNFVLKDAKLGMGTAAGRCGSWVDCPENAAREGFPASRPAPLQVDWVKIYQYR